eukprot:2979533-Amphidinium_carterae.1
MGGLVEANSISTDEVDRELQKKTITVKILQLFSIIYSALTMAKYNYTVAILAQTFRLELFRCCLQCFLLKGPFDKWPST